MSDMWLFKCIEKKVILDNPGPEGNEWEYENNICI